MKEIKLTVTLISQEDFNSQELRRHLRHAADNLNHWANALHKQELVDEFLDELEENDGEYFLTIRQTDINSYKSKMDTDETKGS